MPTHTGDRSNEPENLEAVLGALALGATLLVLGAGVRAALRDGPVVPVATYGPLVVFGALITIVFGHLARRVARATGAGRRLSRTVVSLGWLVLVASALPVALAVLVLTNLSL